MQILIPLASVIVVVLGWLAIGFAIFTMIASQVRCWWLDVCEKIEKRREMEKTTKSD